MYEKFNLTNDQTASLENTEPELPNANFYLISVPADIEKPLEASEPMYFVKAALCPYCEQENYDVELGIVATCYKCNKKFAIRDPLSK